MHPSMYNSMRNRITYAADTEGANGSTTTDTTDSGNTGDDTSTQTTSEQTDDRSKEIEEAVKGLKAKNAELLAKLKKKTDEDKTKTSIDTSEYEEYRKIKERIERDELLKLMAEGKSEEALTIANRKVKAEADAALAVEREERVKALAEAAAVRDELANTKISIALTNASAAVVKPAYQGLVEKLARENVKIVDGTPRVVDGEGELVSGKNGKPISLTEYIESFRTDYPDLFVTSSGGGAQGSNGNKPAGQKGKFSPEAIAEMSMADFVAARSKGLI